MNNKLSKIVVISLAVVVIISLVAVAAFAQDDADPETPTTQVMPFGHGGFHDHFGGDQDEDLAAALGITVEELQAARQQAAAERIAQAVEDGLITQEQADTMLAMQALQSYIDREAILAEALGLTVDELADARADGTLQDLLDNITPAELQASMQAAHEAAVAQAVEDGVITQAQADLVLEQLASGLGMGGHFGGHHGFGGGGRGGFRGFGGVPQSEDAYEAIAPANAF